MTAVLAPLTTMNGPSRSEGHLESLIEPFRGTTQPKASRVATDVAQVQPKAMNVLDAWKYVPFLAHQATALTAAFISHHLFGPPKKSWGIEMTLFTTALRTSVDYSYLSNLTRMRRAINLGQILPTPKDGIVTPVTFRVKSRGLKGFLADADAREDGSRELNGEWVINRRIWRKMQDQHRHKNHASIENKKDRVIFYLHGGAYYIMSPATHRFLTIMVSKYTECRIFALDYRLAPETIFPGQLHDAVAGYFRLVYDLKIPPENIILGGDSAGGGLCMALMLYLRDNEYPLPSGAFVMSPWVDLSMSCESWDTNASFDYLPRPADNDHMNPVKCFLGTNITENITHPYASPLFGDYKGIPPVLIQCGDAEVLRDEAVLLAYKASSAGVYVEHEIYEDCVHVFQAFTFLEASRQALHSIRRYVKRVLPAHQARAAREHDNATLDGEVMADAHAVREDDGELESKNLPQSPTSTGPSDEGEQPSAMSASSEDSEPEEVGDDSMATAAVSRAETAMLNAGVALGGRPNAFSASNLASMRMTKGESADSSYRTAPTTPKRPSHAHKRSNTEAYGALPLRLRSSSHPDMRALMDSFSQANDNVSRRLYRDGARSRTQSHVDPHHPDSRNGSRRPSHQSSLANSRQASDDEADGDYAEFATRRQRQ